MRRAFTTGRSGIVAAATLAAVLPCLLGRSATASDYEIDLVFQGALDLPRVNMLILDENGEPYVGTNPLQDWFGDDFWEEFGDLFDESSFAFVPGFYDTGASGIVLAPGQAADMGLPVEADVFFEDIGVGGMVEFEVTTPLDVRVAPHNLMPQVVGNANGEPLGSIDLQSYADSQAIPFNGVRMAVGPIQETVANPDELDQLIQRMGEVNVFGMPLFADKVAVMDVRPLNAFAHAYGGLGEDGDLEELLELVPYVQTSIYDADTADTNPAVPTPDVRIRTSYASFSDYVRTFHRDGDGVETDLDASNGPDLRHNPFIGANPILTQVEEDFSDDTPGITISRDTADSTGSWLFDTGAAATMISTEQAGALGVSYAEGTAPGSGQTPLLVDEFGQAVEEQFYLTVQGIAGQVEIGGFWLDELLVPTIEGDTDPSKNLLYRNVPVLVLDILIEDPNSDDAVLLDGIFGMNLLLPSIFVEEPIDQFGIAAAPVLPGAFDTITFNEETGIVGLNFVPEPSTLALLLSGGTLVLLRRRRA